MKLKIIVVVCLMIALTGCDAFVKKFTRKPKGPVETPQMVLAPEEYKSKLSREDVYRQYFVYWRSWQTELWSSLEEHRSQSKKLDCAAQAIKNLEQMKPMLNESRQAELEKYIGKMREVKERIDSDIAGYNDYNIRDKVDMLRLEIVKKFEYRAIKTSLK